MNAKAAGDHRPALIGPLLWPLIAGVLFFAFGMVGIHYIQPSTSAAYVWPASGVTIAVLALVPVARWPVFMGAIAIAAVAVGLRHGDSIGMTVAFALIELVASGAAALVLQRLFGAPLVLNSVRRVAVFCLVGALGAAMLSGLLGVALLSAVTGANFADGWSTWVIANTVGTLIVAPAVLAWSDFRPKRSGGMGRRDFLLGVVFFGLLLVTLFVVFDDRVFERFSPNARLALTYLPEPFVVLTALAWGVRGGSLALLAVAAIALLGTTQGNGHFVSAASDISQSIYELQVYLAITAIMSLLIAALRAEQERALRQSDVWRIRYEAAAAATGQAVFDVDPRTGSIAWAGDVERILGVPASHIASIDAIAASLDTTARAKLRLLFDALRASATEAQAATITWIGGAAPTHVEFAARSIADFEGTVYRIAGVARVVGTDAGR